jgi:hypothetical protein
MIERKLAADRQQRPGVGLDELAAEDGLRGFGRDAEGLPALDAPDDPAQLVERARAAARIRR